MSRPGDIPTVQWLAILKAGKLFVNQWSETAHHFGGTTPEIFGIHATAPTRRYGCQGLVYGMADDNSTLVGMNEFHAEFRTGNGARQVFRRDCFNMDRSPLRMLWD
ncbi:MAG: hypothetical protein HQL77_19100 [Magnetococcales bacterium]|nr:hypothetical protein [Magnetococcales bacterium]